MLKKDYTQCNTDLTLPFFSEVCNKNSDSGPMSPIITEKNMIPIPKTPDSPVLRHRRALNRG